VLCEALRERPDGEPVAGARSTHFVSQERVIGQRTLDHRVFPEPAQLAEQHLLLEAEVRLDLEIELHPEAPQIVGAARRVGLMRCEAVRKHQRVVVLLGQATKTGVAFHGEKGLQRPCRARSPRVASPRPVVEPAVAAGTRKACAPRFARQARHNTSFSRDNVADNPAAHWVQ
jgi:hypothetical protein